MTTDCIIVICVLGVFQLLDILQIRQVIDLLKNSKKK